MNKLDQLTELICDLYWEYDRMSNCGQETLDKMAEILGVSLGAAPAIDSIEFDNAKKECIRNGHRDSGRGVCVDCGEFLNGME